MTVRPFVVDVPQPVLDDLHDRLSRTRFLDDSPRRPASGMTVGVPAGPRRVVADVRLARSRGVAERAPAVPRGRRRRDAALRPPAVGQPGRAGAPRDARLAAHVRAAAGLRRPAARLPRGRGEPAGVRVLAAARRADDRAAARRAGARAHDRRARLLALPHLRRGRHRERQRPHRRDVPRGGRRDRRHARALPAAGRAGGDDRPDRARVLRPHGGGLVRPGGLRPRRRAPGPTPSPPR